MTVNIRYQYGAPEAVERQLADKLDDYIDVKDFGAVPNGDVCDALDAAIAAAAGLKAVRLSDSYKVSRTILLPDQTLVVGCRSTFLTADADNLTFFRNAGSSSYGTVLEDIRLDGGGRSGVTGYDMSNWRVGAGLVRPSITNMTNGVIARELCWATVIHQPYIQNVDYPIRMMEGSRLDIYSPEIDGYVVGVESVAALTYTSYGPRIWGGHIQNGDVGFKDGGMQSSLKGVYFELNTSADIDANGAQYPDYDSPLFAAGHGAVGVKMRNCVGGRIRNPILAGARSLGLFDIDVTNDGVVADIQAAGGFNAALGAADGLTYADGRLVSFSPYVADSGGVGTTVYTVRTGLARDSGRQGQVDLEIMLTWTAHSEAGGNMYVRGLPAALMDGIAWKTFQVETYGFAPPGIARFARVHSDGLLLIVAVDAAGAESYPPIPAAGSLVITGTALR